MKTVLLYAMPSEARPLIQNLCPCAQFATIPFYALDENTLLCVGGVGKVNAAMATQIICDRYAPDLIVNAGVAGCLTDAPVGTIIVASACVQHDVDTTLAGDAPGLVSTVNCVAFPCADAPADKLSAAQIPMLRGIVATGDWFGRDYARAKNIRDSFGAVVCDMEACAAAQVCMRNSVPFLAIKAVSDHLFSENQDEEYADNLAVAADNLTTAIKFLIKSE